LRFLLDHLRSMFAAALAIVLIACAAEVALRWMRVGSSEPAGDRGTGAGAAVARTVGDSVAGPPLWGWPTLASRLTRQELPVSWSGWGVHAETGAALALLTNSLGLRGAEPVLPKPVGTFRVLCLGDERTLGPGLSDDETYPERLAARLRQSTSMPVEVLNAGLPGGCPLTAVVLCRQRLAALAPDLVIVHVDISDALDELACRPTLRLDPAGRPAAVVHRSLEVGEGPLARWEREFALAEWLRRRVVRELGEVQATGHERFQHELRGWSQSGVGDRSLPPPLAALAHLQTLFDPRSARLVLATCPDAWQTSERLRLESLDAAARQALQAPSIALQRAAARLGTPLVDAGEAFVRADDPARLYLPDGQGLSAAGCDLYAETLFRALTGAAGSSPPAATPANTPAATARDAAPFSR